MSVVLKIFVVRHVVNEAFGQQSTPNTNLIRKKKKIQKKNEFFFFFFFFFFFCLFLTASLRERERFRLTSHETASLATKQFGYLLKNVDRSFTSISPGICIIFATSRGVTSAGKCNDNIVASSVW
jgi:hypothetical protein